MLNPSLEAPGGTEATFPMLGVMCWDSMVPESWYSAVSPLSHALGLCWLPKAEAPIQRMKEPLSLWP